MDPNEALERGRAAARNLENSTDEFSIDMLVESFQVLDEWLSGGGFLPSDWATRRRGA